MFNNCDKTSLEIYARVLVMYSFPEITNKQTSHETNSKLKKSRKFFKTKMWKTKQIKIPITNHVKIPPFDSEKKHPKVTGKTPYCKTVLNVVLGQII